MDTGKDDKSIVEKTVDAMKEFAATVSDAAHKAVEPEPIKPGDEVVMMPMAAAGFMGDTVVPPFVVVSKQKKSPRKSRAKAAKKAAKKSVKKTKTAKRTAKKAKPPAGRKAVGKKTKSGAKKNKAKKSRR
jgi:hypothetical protein